MAFLLLAGCTASGRPPASNSPVASPPTVAAPEPARACDADKAKFAVGQVVTSQLEATARTRAGASSVRTLRPDQVVTLDFNSSRLNLVVDARNQVTAVRCG
ncbi:I78 family peptidase inhibitor [Variovorax sp. KK3]|uniref:I78 family peptidase inhibitor n=1 Tax=Variovorax sp. KK3 TaxID=1855728 RepID=UPI0009F9B3FE|nr:I78 family peptidase inhibitor [Variovorax sp. KK3]